MNDEEPKNNTLIVVGGIIGALAMLFSYLLIKEDRPTAAILSIAGPVLGSIFVAGYVKELTSKQNRELEVQTQSIEQVKNQTNGKLDAKFKEQSDAINELHDKVDALVSQNVDGPRQLDKGGV